MVSETRFTALTSRPGFPKARSSAVKVLTRSRISTSSIRLNVPRRQFTDCQNRQNWQKLPKFEDSMRKPPAARSSYERIPKSKKAFVSDSGSVGIPNVRGIRFTTEEEAKAFA